ncbi:transporter [Methylopila henanensis]|uniref:Transporter n=1 Tax=Methylopila henanensis TaxID=873516 RepID=A0ABW4K5X1_9HYPH
MKIATAGAFALGAMTTAAFAGATAQPGETAGLAAGAPLPEGLYFVNTFSWGSIDTPGKDTKLLVDIPLIAWSTPWQIFGGNVQVLAATPLIHRDAPGGALDDAGFYNPFLAGRIAFDLGGGLGVSYLSGIYFNVGDNDVSVRATTWRQDFAVSYTNDGWNLTANLIWGNTFDTDRAVGGKTSNGFNLDLTATKTFGKWEIGAIGFGSTEYDLPEAQKRSNGGPGKAETFAVGPLIGYNFGPVILQAALTTSIYSKNSADDTRFWSRIVIPLWSPEKPLAPLVTKY